MGLTNEQITAKNFKEFYEHIRPYLNGNFPTPIVNKFDKANLYSTDEQIVGRWIDGKPLYQKTIIGNTPSSTSETTIYTGNTNDNIRNIVGYIASGIPINCYDTNNWRTKTYIAAPNNIIMQVHGFINMDYYITIQYTKTTDETIAIDSDTDYSLEEKIIGTWIDGKPIYRKVINGSDNISNKITGTIFYSSQYNDSTEAAKNAFDSDDNTHWLPAFSSDPSFIGYKNTSKFIFKYATVKIWSKGSDRSDWVIQGSNDGTNWTNISDIISPTQTTKYTLYSNGDTTEYTNIRLYTSSSLAPYSGSGCYTQTASIEFYCYGIYDTILKNELIYDKIYKVLEYTKTADTAIS